ncbi:hypothetical protein DL546_003043 [Coniochaeta pulveracea]|uniref:Uncharacterized protein n=1 Tax=Coniochaeta pulveracea TaxID=177199 RepID=A0A420Y1L4_9PEZI|nr:hypothetical protein DL546_003043 [Coniochaeta pulveracea]
MENTSEVKQVHVAVRIMRLEAETGRTRAAVALFVGSRNVPFETFLDIRLGPTGCLPKEDPLLVWPSRFGQLQFSLVISWVTRVLGSITASSRVSVDTQKFAVKVQAYC